MKNITITLDERTAEWARTEATAQGLSLSRYVGEVLRKQLPQAVAYEEAMNRWFASMQQHREPLRKPGEKLPTREEIYNDRPVFRRR